MALNSYLGFKKREFIQLFFDFFQCQTLIKPRVNIGKENYENGLNRRIDHYIENLKYLEEEFLQVMHTTHQSAINQYFLELKDYRRWVTEVDEDKLKMQFELWNDEIYAAFEKSIDEKTEEYFRSNKRNLKHLEKYQEPDNSFLALVTQPRYGLPKMRTRVYHAYYEIEEMPGLFDLQFFPNYIRFLKSMSQKLETLMDKYISQFDARKLVSSSTVIVNHLDNLQAVHAIVSTTNDKQLPESPKQKIKWNGTPQEFVEHFAVLINKRKIFLNKESESDTDPIVKLLHEAFEIKKAKGDGDISLNSLSTYFKEYNSANAKTPA